MLSSPILVALQLTKNNYSNSCSWYNYLGVLNRESLLICSGGDMQTLTSPQSLISVPLKIHSKTLLFKEKSGRIVIDWLAKCLWETSAMSWLVNFHPGLGIWLILNLLASASTRLLYFMKLNITSFRLYKYAFIFSISLVFKLSKLLWTTSRIIDEILQNLFSVFNPQ